MNNHKKSSLIFFILLIWTIFITPVIFKLIIYFAPIKVIIPLQLNPSCSLILVQILSFLPFILLYIITNKGNVKQSLRFKKLSFKNIFLIILIGIFIQPILMLINFLTLFFTQNALTNVFTSSLKYPFWQIFLAIAIIPPFLEEILFRGIILYKYDNYSFWYGIIFSSIFFAMIHLNLNQFCYTIVLGFILEFLVKATDSIWAVILCHFVFNGSQVILNNILGQTSIIPNIIIIIIFILSIILSTIFIYIFVKINKNNIVKNTEKNKEKVFNIFFILDIIILIYIFIKN